MANLDIPQISRTYRGTWEEILAHSSEIPKASQVEVRIFEPKKQTPTMTLMQTWLEEDATDDPEELCLAEEKLREFKRNMNQPRKEAGERLPYPEVEV